MEWGDYLARALIAIGILGALGTIMGAACCWAIHRSNEMERKWWEQREREWRDRQ